ncbi:MAG TPA: Trk family potassium uptake protein, partial [Ruminococcaceae bacterium]|nr:Trk family potassium uptake protein [Oscillospiraceae bacterium]
FFFFCDFGGMPIEKRIFASLFQSVTTRTAGFNTADLTAMTGASKAIMTLLMLIGGSPGSTAGGMKTTTFAVIILCAVSVIKRKEEICVCGRRIDNAIVRNALAIAAIYFSLFFIGGVAISVLESLPLSDCLYETASAIGTVGLTLGITPKLGIASQIILILLMYLGRVGGLTLVYAAISNKNQSGAKLPLEKITVG